MNKPLTIEQLKALPMGEWVWLDFQYSLDRRRSGYYQIKANKESAKVILCGIEYDYLLCDYGTTWLAYKNKEQADGKEEEIRKQTAKEILQDIKQCQTIAIPDRPRYNKYELDQKDFNNIADRYGVEVEG